MERSGVIHRAPQESTNKHFDLIIIGGGIYGAMLALESTRRGLRPLLLERGDFGGETSFNSLRIVHGGLRYLQKLDLHRFRESVAERKWFLKTFPHLVKPLPCLMPLYGKGLHRPSILKLALRMNDRLSARRNLGVSDANHLSDGHVIGVAETKQHFPGVAASDLKGAAKWYDAVMLNSQRVLIEVLRWACSLGATVFNYTEADELLMSGDSVSGVSAIDSLADQTYQFHAPIVVNAAGPWSRNLAGTYHKDFPDLFRPSLAWNLLLDRPALSDHALALCPRKNEGHTYFLVPWNGKIFAGTGHAPVAWEPGGAVMPTQEQLSEFLADLNAAVPELNLALSDIAHVHAGLLPAKQTGGAEITVREVIMDHAGQGGPKGFYSVSGVKFTTARLVAEKAMNMIAPHCATYTPRGAELPDLTRYLQSFEPLLQSNGASASSDQLLPILKTLINEESVCCLEDLVFRRTALYENAQKAINLAPEIVRMLPSEAHKPGKDLERLTNQLSHPLSSP